MRKIILTVSLLASSGMACAQTAAFNGYCTLGSTPAITSGLPSSNLNQGLIPQCQVTVYLTGTTNFASIYADATNTPLTNPFTASTKAQWLFFAATQQGYDVVMNGGFPPLVYTVPVTLTDLIVGAGGGSGGCVASGVAGTLLASNGTGGCQPAQVEVNGTPLSTPSPINFVNSANITFSNTSAGNISAVSGPTLAVSTDNTPNHSQTVLNFTDTPTILFTNPSGGVESATCVTATSSLLGCSKPDNTTVTISGGVLSSVTTPVSFKHDGTLLTGPFAANPQIYDYDESSPTADAGYLNATGRFDTATGKWNVEIPSTSSPAIQMQNTAAPAGNGIFVPFTAGNATLVDPCDLVTTNVDAKSGAITSSPGSLFCHNASATLTWSLAALPAGVSAGDVTGVYVLSNNWDAASSPGPTSFSCSGSGTIPTSIPPDQQVAVGPLSGITGANIGTVTCSISFSQSTAGAFIVAQQTQIGLWVTLSTTPPPQTAILNIGPGLEYLSVENLLQVRPFTPNGVWPLLVSHLPPPSLAQNGGDGYPIFFVDDLTSDAAGATCVGGGSYQGWCASSGGGYYVTVTFPHGGGGSGSVTSVATDSTLTGGPITTTGTLGLNLAHANTWTAAQTFNLGLTIASGHSLTNTGVTDGCATWATGVLGSTGTACGSGGSTAFSALTSSTNTTAAMLVGSGASLAPTGTGTIQATDIASTITQGTNVTITGSGTTASPYNISASGGGAGGYTNVTGSASETTVALINTACGSGTYYATTPLSIATGGTVTCPVQFSKEGLWTIASGQTVTFAQLVTETDAPAQQHIAGSGSVVFSNQAVPVEWIGLVGDGNPSANTGTDNGPAIANINSQFPNGGTLLWQCGLAYRFATTGPVITTSSLGADATGCYGYDGSSSSGPVATLFTSSASATVFDVHGVSGSNITWNKIQNLVLSRAVPPAAAAIGLNLHYTGGAVISKNQITDSTHCMDLLLDQSYGTGLLSDNNCNNGYEGVAQSVGAAAYYGFYADGSTTGYGSMRGERNTMSNNTAVITSAPSYGFYGLNQIVDLTMWNNMETAHVQFPIYLTSASTAQDVHINGGRYDNCYTCVTTNFTAAGFANTVTISDSWMAPTANSAGYCADIESGTTGTTINSISLEGGQCFLSLNGQEGIHIHGGDGVSVTGVRVVMTNSNETGIHDDESSGSIISQNIVNVAGETGATGFKFTGAAANIFKNNVMQRGISGSTGVNFDASSSNNQYAQDNIFYGCSTCIVDAGTNNQTSSFTFPGAGIANSTGSAWGTSYTTSGSGTVIPLQTSPVLLGTPDASGATQFKLPVAAGATTLANGELKYDTTNLNWHGWVNGADMIFLPLASGFTTGHCGQPTLHTNTWQIDDAGGACGVSGGGAAFSAITAGTNANALVMGSGGTLDVSGTGTINATKIGGITVTGTPSTGYVPTATSSSAATWQAPAGGTFQYTVLGNPPAVGSFTWVNQGSSTTSNNSNAILVGIPNNTSLNWRLLQKSSPGSTPWSVAAYFKSWQYNLSSIATGLYLYDGTKLLGIEFLTQGTVAQGLRVERISSVTSDNSTVYGPVNVIPTSASANLQSVPWTGGVYLRWRNNGTNLYADYSMDGANWINLYSEAVGTFITPNAYGFGGVNVTGTSNTEYLDLMGWLETNSATL